MGGVVYFSFAIFQSNLFKYHKIPISSFARSGEYYKFKVKGNTGGAVDVIIRIGNIVYKYDVKLLYLFNLKEFHMPPTESNPTFTR